MKPQKRIVAAVVHDDTQELEVVVEITTFGRLQSDEENVLQSVWFDVENLAELSS